MIEGLAEVDTVVLDKTGTLTGAGAGAGRQRAAWAGQQAGQQAASCMRAREGLASRG